MRIPFRHGIVRVPANFLRLASGKVSTVITSVDPLVVTFADGTTNYIITDRLPITNAWTGPFVTGIDYWLYIDINIITGERTFGYTVHAPVAGDAAPVTPLVDQHWFDTNTTVQRVWNGNGWIRKIRVFIAKLQQGSVFVSVSANSPLYTGTQVGLSATQPINAGSFVFDGVGAPLKKADGTFFTTEDVALTGIASSTQVKFGSIVIEATADSNLPAYSIVRFTEFNHIDAALSFLVDTGAYGIIETNVATGDVVAVTMEGLVTNSDWDWSDAGINAQLFVDNIGQLTTVVPPVPIPVAAVVDKATILLRPSTLFMNTFNDPATVQSPGTVRLSVPPIDPQYPITVGTNDPRITAVAPHIGDSAVHISVTQAPFIEALTTPVVGNTLFGSDVTATVGEYKTINGTSNQITITHGIGTITVATPQDIGTSANVQFNKNTVNQQQTNVQTLTDGPSVNVDMDAGTHTILLATSAVGATRHLANPTNMLAGTIMVVKFVQDINGARGLTFDTAYKFTGGSTPVFVGQAGNAVNILTFWCDGTNLYEVSRSLAIA